MQEQGVQESPQERSLNSFQYMKNTFLHDLKLWVGVYVSN